VGDKQQIVAELREDALLLPNLVNAALARLRSVTELRPARERRWARLH
jgi:hypothetical protein